MMKKILLLTLIAFTLTACGWQSAHQDSEDGRAVINQKKIRYAIDTRTDMCFAHGGVIDHSVMATVPCTDKVMAAIREDAKK